MSILFVCLIAFVLAFVSSMPIAGPVAVMVVSRGIEGRFTEARKVGIGSAVSEGIWAGVAFATFSTLFVRYPSAVPIAHSVTSVVLFIVGLQFVRWKPREFTGGEAEEEKSQRGAALLGFLTSLFNPTVLVSWSATSAVIQSRHIVEMKAILAIPFGISVAAGIMCWFAMLVAIMTRYQAKLPRRFLTWFIRGTGLFLIGFALWTVVGVLRNL